jgi:ligand-binding SRPBCC domain-containing protein
MPIIHLTSCIHAPVDRVFNLSRSISLHKAVIRKYDHGNIDGGGSEGLMKQGDKIRFQLKLMGARRALVTQMEHLDFPKEFSSALVSGPFKSLHHQHHFKSIDNGTLLIDLLEYEPAFGLAGKMADAMIIRSFLKKYLEAKNKLIKQYAEGEKWKVVIPIEKTTAKT